MQSHPVLLRRRTVLARYPKCNTVFYEDIKNGLFTPGVKIGGTAVAWPEHEVSAINAARIAGKNEDEIRTLVKLLLTKRARAAEVTYTDTTQ